MRVAAILEEEEHVNHRSFSCHLHQQVPTKPPSLGKYYQDSMNSYFPTRDMNFKKPMSSTFQAFKFSDSECNLSEMLYRPTTSELSGFLLLGRQAAERAAVLWTEATVTFDRVVIRVTLKASEGLAAQHGFYLPRIFRVTRSLSRQTRQLQRQLEKVSEMKMVYLASLPFSDTRLSTYSDRLSPSVGAKQLDGDLRRLLLKCNVVIRY
jgi:hypothetical protein